MALARCGGRGGSALRKPPECRLSPREERLTAWQATSTIVYRIFFHPLAKYPGPFLAKITDGYQLYHAWKGDRHIDFWRMHQKYGTVPALLLLYIL